MADEEAQRKAVVAEALSWVGTPFRDCQDVKGAGVDCAMFVVRVYAACGLIPADYDPRPYKPRWFVVSREEKYADMVGKFARRIEESEARAGDVVLYHHGLCHAHSAIVVDDLRVVHAWFKDKQVAVTEKFTVELVRELDGSERSRMYFSFWGR